MLNVDERSSGNNRQSVTPRFSKIDEGKKSDTITLIFPDSKTREDHFIGNDDESFFLLDQFADVELLSEMD